MQNYGALISFCGRFSQEIIEKLVNTVKKYLETAAASQNENFNVFSIFIEQTPNIKNYSAQKDSSVLGKRIANSGIVAMGSNKELSLVGPHLLGASFLLIGQLCYGCYTVFSKELNDKYSTYQIFAYIMVINAGLFFVIALPELNRTEWNSVPEAAVYSIASSSPLYLP